MSDKARQLCTARPGSEGALTARHLRATSIARHRLYCGLRDWRARLVRLVYAARIAPRRGLGTSCIGTVLRRAQRVFQAHATCEQGFSCFHHWALWLLEKNCASLALPAGRNVSEERSRSP